MSALQLYRYMGFGSYKTAWLMCHKVRTALMQDIDKLGGIVEVDETFVGGLAKNRHWDKRGGGGGTGGIGSGKTPIVGAVSRKSNVVLVARVVANISSATLTAFVREAVSHSRSRTTLALTSFRSITSCDGRPDPVFVPNSPTQLKRFIIAALCARKNGGCPHADTVGLFLASKCEIRMPLRRFDMAHPISQDYTLQTFEKAHLPGAS